MYYRCSHCGKETNDIDSNPYGLLCSFCRRGYMWRVGDCTFVGVKRGVPIFEEKKIMGSQNNNSISQEGARLLLNFLQGLKKGKRV